LVTAEPSPLAWSLERLAELRGDPTAAVYERLFAERPDLEALFVLDRQGQVRGAMLANVFEALMDIAVERRHGLNLILAERTNHEGLGVSPAMFMRFFEIVLETTRDALGAEWTPRIEAAWRSALAEIGAA
jgi:hemoglobin-like flavoprotein